MSLKRELLKMKGKSALKDDVIDEILNSANTHSDEDLKSFINDVIYYGCASGAVPGMIYYTDTHKFFDKHYDEIMDLVYEYEQEIGEKIHPDGDMKNFYAWLAFEITCQYIAAKLGI